MGKAKPSKRQRVKQKKAAKVKATNAAVSKLSPKLNTSENKHVKFNEEGEVAKDKVAIVGKKRARLTPSTTKPNIILVDQNSTGGGKSDRSPEMIQSAKYYLEQWKMRDAPKSKGVEQWKFKKVKQLWILRWMFEADVIPKSMFTLVLEYLNGMQGVARQRVLESAHKIIDAGMNKDDETVEESQDVTVRLARRRYKRAMQVAQLLA